MLGVAYEYYRLVLPILEQEDAQNMYYVIRDGNVYLRDFFTCEWAEEQALNKDVRALQHYNIDMFNNTLWLFEFSEMWNKLQSDIVDGHRYIMEVLESIEKSGCWDDFYSAQLECKSR